MLHYDDIIRLSPRVSFAYLSQPDRFMWINHEEDSDKVVFYPTLKFDGSLLEKPESNIIDNYSNNENYVKIEESHINFLIEQGVYNLKKSVEEYNEKYYVSPDVFDKLEDFILLHAPWTKKWGFVKDEDTGSKLDYYARETLGKYAPDDISSFITAHLLTTPFLVDIGLLKEAFDDGFYRETNIDTSHDIKNSLDIRDGLLKSTGTYSRPLARSLKSFFSNSTFGLAYIDEALFTLKMCRGLPSEYIVYLIDKGVLENNFPIDILINGYNGVYPPSWILEQSPQKRVKWMQDMDIFLNAIHMSQDVDMSEVNVKDSSIEVIYSRIVEAYYKDTDFSDNISYGLMAGKRYSKTIHSPTRILDIKVLSTPADLAKLGSHMNICIGSSSYIHKLMNNESSFFSCSVDNEPVVAIEFSHSNNEIFEIRGKNNSVIPKEEVTVISQEIKNAISSLSR